MWSHGETQLGSNANAIRARAQSTDLSTPNTPADLHTSRTVEVHFKAGVFATGYLVPACSLCFGGGRQSVNRNINQT